MINKDNNNSGKFSKTNIMVWGALILLGGGIALGAAELIEKNNGVSDFVPKSVSVEKAPNLYYEQKISFDTVQRTLDESIMSEKDEAKLQDLVETFITGTQVNASNYTEVFRTMIPDIIAIENEDADVDVIAGKNLDHISNKMVKGFLDNLTIQMLKLNQVGDQEVQVVVDYKAIKEKYSEHFNDFIKNVVDFEIMVAETSLVNSRNVIDVDNAIKLINKLEKIEDGKADKDKYYWEYHRYQLYAQLFGLGVESVNIPEGEGMKVNEEYVEQIKKASNEKENVKLKAPFEKIMSSLKEEKFYGPKTTEVANKLVNEEFTDYTKFIEQEKEAALEQ